MPVTWCAGVREKVGASQFDAQNEIEPITRKAVKRSIYWTYTGTRMEADGGGWRRMEADGGGWRRTEADGAGRRRMEADGAGWKVHTQEQEEGRLRVFGKFQITPTCVESPV